MMDFLSAFKENADIAEALVTTLTRLVPGFEQAYGESCMALKQPCGRRQAKTSPKQSVIDDQLVETVRELAEDR